MLANDGDTVFWRMGWDSNPREACAPAGFQDRCLQPLGHPSAIIKSDAYCRAKTRKIPAPTPVCHRITFGTCVPSPEVERLFLFLGGDRAFVPVAQYPARQQIEQ